MLSPVVFGWIVVSLAAISAGVALFAMWLEAKRKRDEEERLALMIEQARQFERTLGSLKSISEAERTGARNNPYTKKSDAEKAESPTNPYKTNNDVWPTDIHRLDGQPNYSPLRLVTHE